MDSAEKPPHFDLYSALPMLAMANSLIRREIFSGS
jgi:hypothetical protein